MAKFSPIIFIFLMAPSLGIAGPVAKAVEKKIEKYFSNFKGQTYQIDLGNEDGSGLQRGVTNIYVPSSIENASKTEKFAMVMLLHGYGGTGRFHTWYLNVLEEAGKKKFILVVPEGKQESRLFHKSERKNQFWKANGYCCDFREESEKSKENPLDDVTHLTSVIEYSLKEFPKIDSNRVFLYGHSNGAMMAHRMACEKSELISGIATFAGQTVKETEKCKPSSPISVLQIHSTGDDLITYDGDAEIGRPGTERTFLRWAEVNECSGKMTEGPWRNLIKELFTAPRETQSFQFGDCKESSHVALWKIFDAEHTPFVKDDFSDQVLTWLFKNKPSKDLSRRN